MTRKRSRTRRKRRQKKRNRRPRTKKSPKRQSPKVQSSDEEYPETEQPRAIQQESRHKFEDVRKLNLFLDEEEPDPFHQKDPDFLDDMLLHPVFPKAPDMGAGLGKFFPECATCGSHEPHTVMQFCSDTCPYRYYHYECLVEYISSRYDTPCPGCGVTYQDPLGRIHRYVDNRYHHMIRFDQMPDEPNGYRLIDLTEHDLQRQQQMQYYVKGMQHMQPPLLVAPPLPQVANIPAVPGPPLEIYEDEDIDPFDAGLVPLFEEQGQWKDQEKKDPLLDIEFYIQEPDEDEW